MEMDLSQALAIMQQRHQKVASALEATPQAWMALEADYHRLLSQAPDHPAILFGLGTLYSQTDRAGAGIAMLHRAVEHGCTGPEPWLNLGAAYKCEHKDETAAKCYGRALDLCTQEEWEGATNARNGIAPRRPPEAVATDRSSALHGMASLYVNAGQPEKIIEWADKALESNPRDRFALWNKGLGLLESGSFAQGFALYDRAGFMEGGTKPPERKVKTYGGLPKWNGTPGKAVICYGEQGVGDEIMFASMLPDLMRDCRVIIDCDRRLEAMFKRSFPEAEAAYPTSGWNEPFPWIANHKPDAWVPMGSLGMYYRPDFASFPRKSYLKPDAAKVAKWSRILGTPRAPRIGISWAGGLRKTRFDMRSMPLAKWAPVLQTPGIEWISLQYHDQAADEVAQVGASINVPIHHWGDAIASYEETAGLLHNLDLVITVNTSLLHLCGSLGINTWCLTPVYCAWRYQCSGEQPWYGSVTTFRQEKPNEWGPVLARVAETLRAIQTVAAKEAA